MSMKTKNSSNKDHGSVLKTIDSIALTFENTAHNVGDPNSIAMMLMMHMQQQQQQQQFKYFQQMQKSEIVKINARSTCCNESQCQEKGQDVDENV